MKNKHFHFTEEANLNFSLVLKHAKTEIKIFFNKMRLQCEKSRTRAFLHQRERVKVARSLSPHFLTLSISSTIFP